jgi:hypothetical protein
MRQAAEFGHTAPDEATVAGFDFTEKEAQTVVLSAFKRGARRIDWESDEERQDARRGLAEEFEVDAMKSKWSPPRNIEPTHLPV